MGNSLPTRNNGIVYIRSYIVKSKTYGLTIPSGDILTPRDLDATENRVSVQIAPDHLRCMLLFNHVSKCLVHEQLPVHELLSHCLQDFTTKVE